MIDLTWVANEAAKLAAQQMALAEKQEHMIAALFEELLALAARVTALEERK